MTPTCSYTEKYVTGHMIFTNPVHLKCSLLYEHICLRIDVFQINYCMNILFIIWFLSVFYSITFVLLNTDLTQRIWICSFTDKQYWNLCSIWDIFILIRCVFLQPVRCYLQVLLGLHRANGEISNKRLFTNFVCRFYTFHTSHAVFLPLPSKNETVSHPVGAWNISNRDTFSRPRDVAMAWAGRLRSCLEEPYDFHCSSRPSDITWWCNFAQLTSNRIQSHHSRKIA